MPTAQDLLSVAQQDLLSVAQAAEELGLAPVSIRHAIMRGTLGVVRLDGRTNVVPRRELERYRQEHLRKRGSAVTTTVQPATQAAEE